MHVVHEVGAAVQRPLGDRIEVADDEVGLEPHLEQRVGAAVDTDEHRSVLADVRAQVREVLAVVVAADDDERVAALEARLERRELERIEDELAPRAATYSSVFSANRSSSTPIDARRAASIAASISSASRTRPGREQLVAAEDVAADDADRVAVVEPVEQLVADVVDERDPGLDDADRARRSGSDPRSTATR